MYELIEKKLDSFESKVKHIAKLTDENDHTGALMAIANLLDSKKMIKVLKGIKMIADAEGHMPSELMRYRDNMLPELLKLAKKKLSNDNYDKLLYAI